MLASLGAGGLLVFRRKLVTPPYAGGRAWIGGGNPPVGCGAARAARITPVGQAWVRIVGEEAPGALAGVEDPVVGFPDEGAEGVLAQIRPDVLHRVQLG
jgi:hypothetical protein